MYIKIRGTFYAYTIYGESRGPTRTVTHLLDENNTNSNSTVPQTQPNSK